MHYTNNHEFPILLTLVINNIADSCNMKLLSGVIHIG